MKHFFLPGMPPLRKAATRIAMLAVAMLATNLLTQAQVVFDNFTNTGSPPAKLGLYPITSVVDNTNSNGSLTNSVPLPNGDDIQLNNEYHNGTNPLTVVSTGAFFPWGHGYSGKAYGNLDSPRIRLYLPPGVKAFYLYAKPLLITGEMTVTAYSKLALNDYRINPKSAQFTKTVSFTEAQFFGFHVTNPDDDISYITIESTSPTPYVGEFGYYQCSRDGSTFTASSMLTCANPRSTLTLNANNASYASFNFSGPNGFSQSGASNTVTVSEPGEYSVFPIKAGNAVATCPSFLAVGEDKSPPTNVTLSNNIPPLTCQRTSVTLIASSNGGSTYTFTGPNGFSRSGTSALAQVFAVGNYSVVATGANGCSATAQTTTVSEDKNPPTSVTLSNDGALTCKRTSVTLTASSTGGSKYAFSGPNGFSQSGANATASVTAPGTYSVVVTGSNGCSASVQTTTVSEAKNPPENLTLTNDGPLTCNKTGVQLTAGSSAPLVTYAFSGPGISTSSGNSASVNQEGTYTVKATSVNGCTAVQTTTVTANTAPPANVMLNNDGPLTCPKTSVQLIANSNGGNTYAFSGPNGFSQSGTNATASVTTPGTYSVVVTGSNGCSATAQTTPVSSDTVAPAANLTNNGPLSASQPLVTLSASGGSSYQFSTGATQQGSSGNTATVTSPGPYQVTVTGSNGCTAVSQTTVLGGNSPTACRGGTATISVVASGNPVKYEWYKNSINSARLSEVPYLQKGTTTASLTLINVQISADYYAKVTDANGSVVVYGPFHLTVDPTCRARVAAEQSVEPGSGLVVRVLGNPVAGDAVEFEVSGAAGESLRLGLVNASGRVVSEQVVRQPDAVGRYSLPLGSQPAGLLLLRVSTADQSQTVKLLRAD